MPAPRELLEAALTQAAASGAMPFETFMELALYHPQAGFYARAAMRVGEGGDFHTSATIHPAFGTCVARQLAEGWQHLGRPETLRLLELGAGSGQLAEQILSELDRLRLGWKRVSYVILERSASLRADQQRRLRPWKGVRWVPSLEALEPTGRFEGQVLSNEVFDALATRRVIGLNGGLAEIGVRPDPRGGWKQVAMTPTTPRLAETLSALGVTLAEGQCAEVNLQAQDLIRAIAAWLGRGLVYTLDYGDDAAALYAPHRRAGTLRAYYRQLSSPDPLARPGEQDLTADVDFTTLSRVGLEAGLVPVGRVRQGEFLERLGIVQLEAEAAASCENALEADLVRFSIQKLYRPEAMGGGFWVLVQQKGLTLTPGELMGLAGAAWSPERWPARPSWAQKAKRALFPAARRT